MENCAQAGIYRWLLCKGGAAHYFSSCLLHICSHWSLLAGKIGKLIKSCVGFLKANQIRTNVGLTGSQCVHYHLHHISQRQPSNRALKPLFSMCKIVSQLTGWIQSLSCAPLVASEHNPLLLVLMRHKACRELSCLSPRLHLHMTWCSQKNHLTITDRYSLSSRNFSFYPCFCPCPCEGQKWSTQDYEWQDRLAKSGWEGTYLLTVSSQ